MTGPTTAAPGVPSERWGLTIFGQWTSISTWIERRRCGLSWSASCARRFVPVGYAPGRSCRRAACSPMSSRCRGASWSRRTRNWSPRAISWPAPGTGRGSPTGLRSSRPRRARRPAAARANSVRPAQRHTGPVLLSPSRVAVGDGERSARAARRGPVVRVAPRPASAARRADRVSRARAGSRRRAGAGVHRRRGGARHGRHLADAAAAWRCPGRPSRIRGGGRYRRRSRRPGSRRSRSRSTNTVSTSVSWSASRSTRSRCLPRTNTPRAPFWLRSVERS